MAAELNCNDLIFTTMLIIWLFSKENVNVWTLIFVLDADHILKCYSIKLLYCISDNIHYDIYTYIHIYIYIYTHIYITIVMYYFRARPIISACLWMKSTESQTLPNWITGCLGYLVFKDKFNSSFYTLTFAVCICLSSLQGVGSVSPPPKSWIWSGFDQQNAGEIIYVISEIKP